MNLDGRPDHLLAHVRSIVQQLAKVTAERDALHKSYVATVDERDAALACKGCGGTVGHHLAPDQGGCPGRFVIDGVPMVPAAHVDAARAEVERLRGDANGYCDELSVHLGERAVLVQHGLVHTGETMRGAVERLTKERDAAIRERQNAEEETDRYLAEKQAAIRDRDKWRKLAEQISTFDRVAKHEFAASEVERFVANLQPWPITVQVAAAARAAELRKAAGAAAPVVIDEAPGATLPDVEPKVASGKVVEFTTPAADARQPAGEAKVRVHKVTQTGEHFCEHFCEERKKLAEVERREAEGVKLLDGLLATERAKVATMTIEIDAMRSRLAASEKAKAKLLDLAESLVGECDGVEVWRRLFQSGDKLNIVGHAIKDMDMASQKLKAAIAAERAGCAS